MNSLVDRFIRGTFVCYIIIVVIFMGLGGTDRLGGDFKVIIWGPVTKDCDHFLLGELTP